MLLVFCSFERDKILMHVGKKVSVFVFLAQLVEINPVESVRRSPGSRSPVNVRFLVLISLKRGLTGPVFYVSTLEVRLRPLSRT